MRIEQHLGIEQKFRLELLGRLTGQVAHDFNNLIFIISANLDAIGHTSITPNLERPLRAIREAAIRAEKMTTDLLLFSEGRDPEPEPVEINDRISKAVQLLELTLPSHIAVSFDLEPKLPLILINPIQFDLAVVNLVMNACDAMPQGGQIRITTHTEDLTSITKVCLTIRDTGHGIPEEIQPFIFDPFFTTKENDQGTGLGLSQVHGFVTHSEGTIELDSDGGGTTVCLKFPVISS